MVARCQPRMIVRRSAEQRRCNVASSRYVLASACAGAIFFLGSAAGGEPGMPLAKSLSPPPVRIRPGPPFCGETSVPWKRCMEDLWGSDFVVSIQPHIVRVGQEITVRAHDASGNKTMGKLHRWKWSTPRRLVGEDDPWVPVDCDPPVGRWTSPPSDGTCRFRVTARKWRGWNQWSYAGAITDLALCRVCGEVDYWAVLEAGAYDLSGHVRNATGRGLAGVRVELTRAGKTSYTVSGADGYYDAILDKGTYTIRAEGARPARVRLTRETELELRRP